jgi:hypothetical protein
VGLCLGVFGMIAFNHRRSTHWIPLALEAHGLSWQNDVLFGDDIPFPDVANPSGQVKFVNRGIGKGTELGYVVKAKMEKLDQSKLPAKYKKVEAHGNYTIEPTETVVYDAHLEFILKDVDGFVLMRTKSESIQIWSGQDNKLQGFAVDSIPNALQKRTESVEVMLAFDKCDTCRP